MESHPYKNTGGGYPLSCPVTRHHSHFSCPLLSIVCALFHFPYAATPLFATGSSRGIPKLPRGDPQFPSGLPRLPRASGERFVRRVYPACHELLGEPLPSETQQQRSGQQLLGRRCSVLTNFGSPKLRTYYLGLTTLLLVAQMVE